MFLMCLQLLIHVDIHIYIYVFIDFNKLLKFAELRGGGGGRRRVLQTVYFLYKIRFLNALMATRVSVNNDASGSSNQSLTTRIGAI